MLKRAYFGLCIVLAISRGQTLRKIGAIDLPGPKGERFDYLTMDDEDHYLLSAHLGPGLLYVIDVRTNQLVKSIPGVPGITGLEYFTGNDLRDPCRLCHNPRNPPAWFVRRRAPVW